MKYGCHFGNSIPGQFVDIFGLRGMLFVMLIEIHKYRRSILPDGFDVCFRIVGFSCWLCFHCLFCINVQPLMCFVELCSLLVHRTVITIAWSSASTRECAMCPICFADQ